MRRFALCALLLATACRGTGIVGYDQCELGMAPSATDVAPGDSVTLTGGPFTVAYDTSIRVGNVPATVTDVTRDSCTTCDECELEALCTPCGACPDCATVCTECVQTATFVVPDVPSGAAAVTVVNRFGTGATVTLQVDAGTTDSGSDSGDSGDSGADSGDSGA